MIQDHARNGAVGAVFTPETRATCVGAAREIQHFELGERRADVRGWTVITGDERIAGVVDKLMVDLKTKEVRYLAVTLAAKALDGAGSSQRGQVLVPIGLVTRVAERRCLVLESLTLTQLVSAPRIRNRPLTRADEDATLSVYGMDTSRDIPHDEFYNRDLFDERGLFPDGNA
jgi:sporulation protein YlmC with PRC-barrel domain